MPQFPPPHWYQQVVAELIDDLEPKLGDLTDESAWKYVAASVMWAERIKVGSRRQSLLHLNDRLTTKAGQELARRGLEWMDDGNFIAGKDSLKHIDRIGRRYSQARARAGKGKWQRNNVTGRSFETVIQELIERRCGVRPTREPKLHSLQGFELAPAGYHSQPDLALFSERDFRILISTKWTLRKERIGTYLHEAYFYRRRRPDLQVAFVVAEFNPNILEWLVNDPLVDRVYHLHLPMFLAVHDPFGNQKEISADELRSDSPQRRKFERWAALGSKTFDLSQLFEDVRQLKTEATSSADEDGDDETNDDGLLEL